MASILLVDDEPNIIEVLEIFFLDEGMEVFTASTGSEALALLQRHEFDIVVSDIRMPDKSGVEILKESRDFAGEAAFIMITAYASTETAIDALQHGAFDYLTKPFKMDELRDVVRRALGRKNQKSEAAAAKPATAAQQGQKLFQALSRSRIIGRSPSMMEIYRTIGTVAPGDSSILITGESGTGKELVARAVHEASSRKDGPFVSINCGAFPETLLESELFGYLKGAFTGAASNKKGLFEAACGGSIFLDEVTEMSPAMQVKLLRVLQERRLRPLGGTAEVSVNVRVIAATNREPLTAIRQGVFREDLYYRIAVIAIPMPPLRDRNGDIELLALHFLRVGVERTGKPIGGIAPDALKLLQGYPWPGNVRELENTLERAVALETDGIIRVDSLPDTLRRPIATIPDATLPEEPFDLEAHMAGIERNLISQALSRTGGNQTLAAQRLKLTKPSLRHKIQVLGIDTSAFRRGNLPQE